MLFSILGVFLAIPLFIFGWKETHPVQTNHHDVVDKAVQPRLNTELSERDRLRATWMEDGATEEPKSVTSASKERIASPTKPSIAQINSTEVDLATIFDPTNKTDVLVDSGSTIAGSNAIATEFTETSLRGSLKNFLGRGHIVPATDSGGK